MARNQTVVQDSSGNASVSNNFTAASLIRSGGTSSQFLKADGSVDSNAYVTATGARSALSFVAGSGAYNSSTGVITIPTNTNQLTNGAGFITGYTETDTLDSVLSRGTSSTRLISLTGATSTTGITIQSSTAANSGSVLRFTKTAAANQVYITLETDQLYFGVPANNTTDADVGTKGSVNLRLQTNYTTRINIGPTGTIQLLPLTSNGFLRTSSGNGTLVVDTNTYLTAESDTLATVTGRGATTSNTIQIGKLGIGRAAGSNESISVENPEGTWLIQGFRSGSSIGGLHTNSGVLHVQAADVRIQASSTATWNGDTLATRPWVTSQGYITGSYLPLSGGTLTGNVQFNANLLQFNNSGVRSWNMGVSGGNLNIYSGDGSGGLQFNGRFVRDSVLRTISGQSDNYSGGTSGWYEVATITLTGNCSGAVLYGTLYDNRYDGADAYQISVVARADCEFSANNEAHYINVGCTILGSTNYTNYRDKIRVVLVASSAGSRTYELQFFETPWNNDTWQLETTGWTIFSSPQAPGSAVGTPRVNYISNQNADNIRANTTMTVGGSTVWHQGNLTNLNQLSNGPGYITSSGSISGNSATTSQRSFSGDISTDGMGRFTGWYNGNAATGLAAEIGISAGQAYIIAYNRQTSSYGTLNLESSGANLRISGSAVNVSSGALQQGGNQVLHAGNYTSYAPAMIYGNSGAFDLNVSGQQGFIRFSQGTWVNTPNPGNWSHVLSFNGSSDNRTVQLYMGDIPGAIWWRMNQGGTQHPWERIWTSNNLTNLNQLTNGPGYITGITSGMVTGALGYTPVQPNGTGASGTWGISITGASASATDALRIRFNDGPRNLSDRVPNTLARSVNWDFVGSGTVGGTGNYAGVMSFTPWDGTTPSTGDSSYQLAFMNETGINGSGLPGLRIRKGIDTTWGSWHTLLHAGNFNSYSPTLTGGNASGTWSINVTGTAGSETLGTVTGRGASTASQVSFTKTDDHAIQVGTIRGRAVGSQGGEYIHMYERVHIGGPGGWGASSHGAPSFGLSTWGSIHVSQSNATGGGIILADDGDIVDLNDAFCSMRFSSGVRIFSANRGGSPVITLGSNGVISAGNITTGVNASHIVQRDGNGYIYANHINFNTSESENPAINSFFTSNGDGWSRKSSIQHVRNQLGNYGGWITGLSFDGLSSKTGGTGTYQTSGDFRAPIFYDSQDTFYYVDPNSTSRVLRMQPLNLGGATLQFRSTDLAVESGSREAITFIDGSQVQAHVSTGNGCGGCCYNWWSSETVQVDPEKDYEFHVWVRSTGNDAVYLGWYEADSSGNTISSNPYFHTGGINTGGTWVKFTAKLKNWRTSSPQGNSNGQDRYASASNMSNDYTGTTDGVMHSNTRFVHIRLGTCYGTVSGSKTYFYGAQIREAGYDDYQQNFVIPYYNGSSWGGKLRFGLNDWGFFGIGMYGAAGEFRMSSDSGNLNLRVDGWIRSENYLEAPDVYTTGGWFRNHTNNNGIYWSGTAWHLYPENSSDFYLRSGNSDVSIHFMAGGTTRNYIHNSASNEIGFLNTGRNWIFRVDNSGNATASGDVTAYSDKRIKSNITTIKNALEKVLQLTGVYYNRIDIEDKSTKLGFIAQDVKEIVPEVVSIQPDLLAGISDRHSIDYSKMVALLTEAIKEQQLQIEDLKSKLDALTK